MSNSGNQRPSVGETLNLAVVRQKKGVNLRAISDSTKISLRFLEAIEAERFDQLPGGVFTTSYLRQYAEGVGIPPEELLSYYRWRMGLDSDAADGNESPARPTEKKFLRVLANFMF
jgi:cytoskeletal protein RodZ